MPGHNLRKVTNPHVADNHSYGMIALAGLNISMATSIR